MDFYEIKKKIVREFENKGYVNKKINYNDFKLLYEPYRKILSEQSFAEIIGISKYSLRLIRANKEKRTIILKRIDVSEQRKIQIKQELKNKGISNSEISYDQFREIFSNYENEMIESKFAELIGISTQVLRKMKVDLKKRVRILKTEEADQDLIAKIITDLKEAGYSNKSITYMEFLDLYEGYRTVISESEFARILSINDISLMKRLDKDARRKVIKTKKVDDELKNDIVLKLKREGYANKKISYTEFLELFDMYKNDMSELEFSKILGITPNVYYKLKKNKSKAIILKRKEPPKEIKEKIQNDLKENGYSGKIVDYEEFLTLFEDYKLYVTERESAKILNITEGAYKSLKYGHSKTAILKEQEPSNVNVNEIRKKFEEMGYINRLITYEEFLKLYEPYKDKLKETEFADILDISFYAYKGLKKGRKSSNCQV